MMHTRDDNYLQMAKQRRREEFKREFRSPLPEQPSCPLLPVLLGGRRQCVACTAKGRLSKMRKRRPLEELSPNSLQGTRQGQAGFRLRR
jgi:hypothetical protein